MSVIIKEVTSKKDLKIFTEFPNVMYKGNPFYVPTMAADDRKLFNPETNASLDFCECACYLAYKDNKPVGRVAAVLNPKANKTWGRMTVRFGWIDFIDDIEVSKALLDTVAAWGKQRGCDEIEGPLGFTDLDPEGMLVEGFDQMGTMITIYNHPYYMEHMEKLGFVKMTDWLEFKINIPETLPDKYYRMARLVEERNNVKVVHYTRSEIKKYGIGRQLFNLVNEAYAHLYGYSLLSERQIDQYVDMYLGLLDLKLVPFIVDAEGNVVGFGVVIPSLAKALQKCNGEIFPFGWYHLLKALMFRKTDTIDFLLIAVKEEYRKKGLTSLIFCDLLDVVSRYGFKYAESSPELETNSNVLNLWGDLEKVQNKRRRIYGKKLD